MIPKNIQLADLPGCKGCGKLQCFWYQPCCSPALKASSSDKKYKCNSSDKETA